MSPIESQDTSYSQEFSTRLNALLAEVESKGRKIVGVILFGSLSNTVPEMEEGSSKLKSDADLLIITEHIIQTDSAGKPLYSDLLTVNNENLTNQPFSEHIPEADIFIKSTEVLVRAFDAFVSEARNQPPKTLVIKDRGNLEEFSLIQAVVGGSVIKGEVPQELKAAAHRAYLEITQRPDRQYKEYVPEPLVF